MKRVQEINCEFVNLLIRALVGVTLFEIRLIASLFIDENNGTENENFHANANEWPQSGKLVFDSKETVRFGSGVFVH